MSDLYQHENHKFSDKGLQLRVPVDLIPPDQYAQLTNAIPVIEGRLEGRAALNWIVQSVNLIPPGSGLHSLVRFNQPSITASSERLAGVDTQVITYPVTTGTPGTVKDTSRSGDPLSLPQFHFASDVASWQVIADWVGMNKYKSTKYVPLGLQLPSAPVNADGYVGGAATAAVGAAGNPNSTGGPGYDWVYTYVNTTTQSESNPSSTNWGGAGVGYEVLAPVTFTAPDPGFGGAAAAGGVTALQATGLSATEQRQSGLISGFPAATAPYQAMYLQMQISFGYSGGTTGGAVYSAVYMSLDGGTSWKLIADSNAGVLSPFVLVQLPINQDPTLVQVRAVSLGVGNTTIPQNVTARRVRQRGGNFSIGDLLTGGGGNASMLTIISFAKIYGVFLTATPATLALVNQKGTVTVRNPNDANIGSQIDAIRLYRRGGSVTASWAFVGQFPVTAHNGTTFNVTDNVADLNLGQFVSLTNDAPITSVYVQQRPLPYIWGPFGNPARLLGCGDPDRPDAVYFSNPGNADQWGSPNWVDVSSPSDPMQNGCVLGTRTFAFSKERMFELVPNLVGTTTYVPFPTPCSRGLISPWGLWPRGSATCRNLYFVAKDGIYMTDGGPEQSIVEADIKPLFPTLDNPLGRQVEGYDSVNLERIEDIRLSMHNDELYFIYRGLVTGNLQLLIYDQNRRRWRAGVYPEGAAITTAYSEEAGPASSLLFGDARGNMYSTLSGSGDNLNGTSNFGIPVTVRTGAFDQAQPLNQKEYGNIIFDIDPGGATVGSPVTITPLLNGETITSAAITVTGSGRQQVPLSLGDVFGFNVEFQITFTKNASINPVLYGFDILHRFEPVSVTHWESRETSNGLPGYQHIRDMYVAWRSTAAATLTLTFDNNYTQTYTLASTGGKRNKVYLPLQQNKFRMVRYSLDSNDSTQGFRIYVDDIEVRCKPWLTSLGYALKKPFGGEGIMATTAFESAAIGREQ